MEISAQCSAAVKNPNRILVIIKRRIEKKMKIVIIPVYKSVVHPQSGTACSSHPLLQKGNSRTKKGTEKVNKDNKEHREAPVQGKNK